MVTICLNMIVKNESNLIEDTLKKLTSKIKFDTFKFDFYQSGKGKFEKKYILENSTDNYQL